MKFWVYLTAAFVQTVVSWTLDRYDTPICEGKRSIASSIGTSPRAPYCLLGAGQSFYLRDMPSNIMVVSWSGPNCTGSFTQFKSVTHSCFKSTYESIGFGPRCERGARKEFGLACDGLGARWRV
ncbi:hypothetical protein M3J09_010363 [Ascochyta lentis]